MGKGRFDYMYKLVNNMEKIDKQDLISLIKDVGKWTRGHTEKIKKSQCLRDIKKFSFPHRIMDIWNKLDKEI